MKKELSYLPTAPDFYNDRSNYVEIDKKEEKDSLSRAATEDRDIISH
jgi:hypothetical protein